MIPQDIVEQSLKTFSLKELTEIYNFVLQRSVKKVESSAQAIKAILGAMPGVEFTQAIEHVSDETRAKIVGLDCFKSHVCKVKKDINEKFLRKKGVGSLIQTCVTQNILNPEEILEIVKEEYPDSKAGYSDVAFVKTQMRNAGYRVPRLVKGKAQPD